MDTIKIQNFAREYPGKDFPSFKSLAAIEAEKIKTIIASKLGVPQDSSSAIDIVKILEEYSSVIPNTNAESDLFNLRSTLLDTDISPKKNVFINWYRFDQIDEIAIDDLSLYFDDIWYPSADYIDIFDDSLSWILSVGYSGEIMITTFPCL